MCCACAEQASNNIEILTSSEITVISGKAFLSAVVISLCEDVSASVKGSLAPEHNHYRGVMISIHTFGSLSFALLIEDAFLANAAEQSDNE